MHVTIFILALLTSNYLVVENISKVNVMADALNRKLQTMLKYRNN